MNYAWCEQSEGWCLAFAPLKTPYKLLAIGEKPFSLDLVYQGNNYTNDCSSSFYCISWCTWVFPNITSLFRIAMVVGDPKKLGSLCLLWSCFLAGPLFISRWNARSTVKTCRNCRYSWSMCAGWSMYRHLQDESTWSPATELVWGGKKQSVAVGNGFSKSYWLHTRNDPKPEKELGSLGSCIFGNYAAQLSKGMMFW